MKKLKEVAVFAPCVPFFFVGWIAQGIWSGLVDGWRTRENLENLIIEESIKEFLAKNGGSA